MPDETFTYQILMEAVFAATDARGCIYPDDSDYVAISLDTVKSIVASFDSNTGHSEAENSHDQARRLWYRIKEYMPRCACGIIRLLSPVPNDLVGIVTREDLLGMGFDISKGLATLDREMLNDDLSEIQDVPVVARSSLVKPLTDCLKRYKLNRNPQDGSGLCRKVEMSLIDPKTKEIFKRSQGGVFGEGKWQVSDIRAFAVWF